MEKYCGSLGLVWRGVVVSFSFFPKVHLTFKHIAYMDLQWELHDEQPFLLWEFL